VDRHRSAEVTTNTDVYATDFAAWCLTTAALVRAGHWDQVDPEALAEELESLGKSQQRELESRLETLVIHLLKWQAQPHLREESHSWKDTMLEQRHELARLLRDNPSLRPRVPTALHAVYPGACTRAVAQMTHRGSIDEPPGPLQAVLRSPARSALPAAFFDLPRTCPWTTRQVLDEEFWPPP
jgi:hypothetical protein